MPSAPSVLLAKVGIQLQLGQPLAEPSRVTGGLLHRMWRIETTGGVYAVKQLAAHIDLNDPLIRRNYEWAETVAASFAAQGVPAIAALNRDGQHVFAVEGSYFLVYPWVDAVALSTETISEPHAVKIAGVLAKIHQLKLPLLLPEAPVFVPYSSAYLLELIEKAEDCHCPFAADLRQHQDALLAMNQAYAAAIPALQKVQCIVHGDLDQKNVLWDQQQQPILIDWEAAGLLNPCYDLINTCLYWSGMTTVHFDQAVFLKMIQAYQEAGGVIDLNVLQPAFAGVYSWINWMVYCIECACAPLASESKTQGMQQVPQTLHALLRLRDAMPGLIAEIKSQVG